MSPDGHRQRTTAGPISRPSLMPDDRGAVWLSMAEMVGEDGMTGRRLFEAGTALALIWVVVAAPGGALATARTSHSAARIWSAAVEGVGKRGDSAVGAVPSPDGSLVFVTGRSWGGASEDDYATVAYDAIT